LQKNRPPPTFRSINHASLQLRLGERSITQHAPNPERNVTWRTTLLEMGLISCRQMSLLTSVLLTIYCSKSQLFQNSISVDTTRHHVSKPVSVSPEANKKEMRSTEYTQMQRSAV
jgi:hypothetical protein